MAPVLITPMRQTRAATRGALLLILLAALKLLLHLLTGWQYGFHRDELYYLAGGLRPAWGYVDHPPLTPILARLAFELFGLSLSGLRLFPALAGAAIVVLTGLLVRRLGGSVRAELLAMIAILLAPLYLGANTLFQTVSFDQLWWVATLYLLVTLAAGAPARRWLLVGVVLGLGVLTKYTILLLIAGIVIGLVATPLRAHLRTPWPWLGAVLTGLIALPNVLWQIANGFPTLTFIRNNSAAVAAEQTRLDVLIGQVMLAGPVALPLVIAGWVFFWSRRGTPFRILGWICVVVTAGVLVLNAKPYYAGPLFPALIAGGAVLADRWLTGLQPGRFRALVVLTLIGTPLAFVTLPILPAPLMVRLGVYELNGDFAEMLGWPELVDAVARAADQLSPTERAEARVLAGNYGQAAALELLSSGHALPPVISGHNSYATWSLGRQDAPAYIVVGSSTEQLADWCVDVRQVGTIMNALGVPNEEQGRPIFICRGPLQPLSTLWPRLARYQ